MTTRRICANTACRHELLLTQRQCPECGATWSGNVVSRRRQTLIGLGVSAMAVAWLFARVL